ncbi:flagellar basal body P-ring formation chaperone FlgA [Thalassobaculum sp. OXR-137]|uniref:flagellar basal body P-ring formation chaperone FlgA n=1 Tax=Thalassobaculum sp. OXR-137 TaxID=3100173 RepID=UPI002AC8F81A|nr:flagellar basal body P-ring formation chaperone FlgA [Thalassobaculum sp. OXR-137]WPZ34163.1 flagellar basal body P-ring formation chaperone FlgA [Thalassobaculum sp. OXR-137]
MIRMRYALTHLTLAATLAAGLGLGLPVVGNAAGNQGGQTGQALQGGQNLPLILNDRITLDHDELMLSDIFANLPEGIDQRISEAPAPGERMVLGARQIWQYAQAFGLNWRPERSKIAIVVTRASLEVPMEAIADTIAQRLAAEHVEDEFDLDMFSRASNIFIAASEPMQIDIRSLSYDPRSKRFDATVSANDGRMTQISGKVVAMVQIPVLRRHAMPGQVITEEMVSWERVAARQASVTTVTRQEDIIGQTARRPLTAGVPVRLTDLKPNLMVTKGDLITLTVRTGTMTLTARGKAMESGTRGAVIRVTNTQSQKVVEARIIGPDMAVVEPASLNNLAALNG